MTTALYTGQWDNSTTTNFRGWGKAISDLLTSAGVPKTADTGQIDWTTVAAPSAASTSQGYEIRYLNDSLNATYPLYVKLEYGSGVAAATASVWLTIGRGSDGAGNLTGIQFTRTLVQLCFVVGSATNGQLYSDGSGFAIAPAYDSSSTPVTNGLLILERSRDSSGAITGEGWRLLSASNGSSSITELIFSFSGWSQSSNTPSHLLPRPMTASQTCNDGTNSYLAEAAFAGSQGRWYQKYTLAYSPADYTVGQTFAVTILGGSHTYRACNRQGFGARGAVTDQFSYLAVCSE